MLKHENPSSQRFVHPNQVKIMWNQIYHSDNFGIFKVVKRAYLHKKDPKSLNLQILKSLKYHKSLSFLGHLKCSTD